MGWRDGLGTRACEDVVGALQKQFIAYRQQVEAARAAEEQRLRHPARRTAVALRAVGAMAAAALLGAHTSRRVTRDASRPAVFD